MQQCIHLLHSVNYFASLVGLLQHRQADHFVLESYYILIHNDFMHLQQLIYFHHLILRKDIAMLQHLPQHRNYVVYRLQLLT